MYEFQARLPKIMTPSIVYSRISGGNIAKKILKACEFIFFAYGCSLFLFLRGMTPKPNLGVDCCSARPLLIVVFGKASGPIHNGGGYELRAAGAVHPATNPA